MKFTWRLLILTFFCSMKTLEGVENGREPEMFYQALDEILRASAHLKIYMRRVDCIMSELKDENAFEAVDRRLITFKKVNNELKAVFENQTLVLEQLSDHVNEANFSCTIMGYVGIFLLSLILIIVVSIT